MDTSFQMMIKDGKLPSNTWWRWMDTIKGNPPFAAKYRIFFLGLGIECQENTEPGFMVTGSLTFPCWPSFWGMVRFRIAKAAGLDGMLGALAFTILLEMKHVSRVFTLTKARFQWQHATPIPGVLSWYCFTRSSLVALVMLCLATVCVQMNYDHVSFAFGRSINSEELEWPIGFAIVERSRKSRNLKICPWWASRMTCGVVDSESCFELIPISSKITLGCCDIVTLSYTKLLSCSSFYKKKYPQNL